MNVIEGKATYKNSPPCATNGGMEHVSDSHQKAIPNLTTRINYINHIRLTI